MNDILIKSHCSFLKILYFTIEITHRFSSLGLNDKSIKLPHQALFNKPTGFDLKKTEVINSVKNP